MTIPRLQIERAKSVLLKRANQTVLNVARTTQLVERAT